MTRPVSEARLALAGLGALLVACGVLSLGLVLGWWQGLPADETAVLGYLPGLLARSLGSAYSFALLAGLCAVPLHGLFTALRYGGAAAPAYERFATWAQTLFTSLGFLGTIIGISRAVAGLAPAMAAGEPGDLIAGLSTAFDTTFLGLTAAILLLVLRKLFGLSAP
ncbi:MotA/TolQ/ExbB proton channel family protein [Marinibacterium profundimaris]|uniref:MotA/TolQ/ExbB proton channel domain-containing protein n=1 Tax=Marinibacterium profundimaris TaxID=1679460 RepID=A0A225NQW1_9RHOB|nr:MotA/TolQ/ExbB proton channel family protein [Marinibacterium profundimaris]OWU77341.1 hypothetical protein ATO3_01035 [Marinibacterium profundimaris]